MPLLEVIYGPEISKYYVPRAEYLEKLAEKDLALEGKEWELAEKNQEIEKMKAMCTALLAQQKLEPSDLNEDEIMTEYLSLSKEL